MHAAEHTLVVATVGFMSSHDIKKFRSALEIFLFCSGDGVLEARDNSGKILDGRNRISCGASSGSSS